MLKWPFGNSPEVDQPGEEAAGTLDIAKLGSSLGQGDSGLQSEKMQSLDAESAEASKTAQCSNDLETWQALGSALPAKTSEVSSKKAEISAAQYAPQGSRTEHTSSSLPNPINQADENVDGVSMHTVSSSDPIEPSVLQIEEEVAVAHAEFVSQTTVLEEPNPLHRGLAAEVKPDQRSMPSTTDEVETDTFDSHEYSNFRLNIMVAGQSGSGKTTLLRALLRGICDHYNVQNQWEAFMRERGSEVVKTTCVVPEEIARLKIEWVKGKFLIITIIDSRGYGDEMDESRTYKPIQDYICGKYAEWRQIDDESRLLDDPRVHCLLYFLQPTRFRRNDAVHMKELSQFAPIVPIISKADTLSIKEINTFLLHGKFSSEEIDAILKEGKPIEPKETCHKETDPGVVQAISSENIEIFRLDKDAPPFGITCLNGTMGYKVVVDDVYAVVANDKFQSDGVPVPREYPWGAVNLNDPYHSDFLRLENMLFRDGNRGLVRLVEQADARYKRWRRQILITSQNQKQAPVYRTHMLCALLFAACFLLFLLSLGMLPSTDKPSVPRVSDNASVPTNNTFVLEKSQDKDDGTTCWLYNDREYCLPSEDGERITLQRHEYDSLMKAKAALVTSLKAAKRAHRMTIKNAIFNENKLKDMYTKVKEKCSTVPSTTSWINYDRFLSFFNFSDLFGWK